MTSDDGPRDAQRMRLESDKRYPANAKRSRRWTYAVALPLVVGLALLGVLLYQRIFGGESTDPLTVNSRARDTLIAQPQPEGWTRAEVVTKCPGEPEGCAGGGFLEVGYVETEWTSPAPGRGVKRVAAVDDACRELAAHLAARSGAPTLDLETCRNAVVDKNSDGFVIGWAEPRGEWAVTATATPTGTRGKATTFAVAFRPDVPD